MERSPGRHPSRTSRRAPAGAAGTWPEPVISGCGRVHVVDPRPEAAGAPGTVTYGLNFQAWCVFLMVMHHVPVEWCAGFLGSMSGTRPSDGWAHALLARELRPLLRRQPPDVQSAATPFCSCRQQGTWPAREATHMPGRRRASHARSRKDCHSRRSLGTLVRLCAGWRLYPRHVDPWLIVLLLILSRCEQGREDHRADATFTAERPLR